MPGRLTIAAFVASRPSADAAAAPMIGTLRPPPAPWPADGEAR